MPTATQRRRSHGQLTGVYVAVVTRTSRKMFGEVPEPIEVAWRNKKVLAFASQVGKASRKWHACAPPDVAEDVELSESVSIAMLTVLETLGPAERAVFVLREVFATPYEEIAAAVGRTPSAVRQIAHRAREQSPPGGRGCEWTGRSSGPPSSSSGPPSPPATCRR